MSALPRFMIAAAHKSSGKTVVSTGLAAALRRSGRIVQPFKKGPDYIDPMWLAAASGRACYNLDFNTMQLPEIAGLLADRGRGASLAMVEANKGLFDGVCLDGSDSNAELAKMLGLPVVLVIDTVGMTRGIAPLLAGYQGFDPALRCAGVILNKVGGARHEGKLRQAVEHYTDLAVLGSVWRDARMEIGERHLGLTTPAETGGLDRRIAGFADAVADGVDLDAVLDVAGRAAPLAEPARAPAAPAGFDGLRIGYLRDAAFGFYYPDDLEAFAAAGVDLVPVDALADSRLPPVDGLFIGGGFPETQLAGLQANAGFRADLRARLRAGLPCYAECGGLMYLCDSLTYRGETAEMVGLIPGRAVMHDRPQGRGHVRFTATPDHPWGAGAGDTRAHEFHYASIEGLPEGLRHARQMTRGVGLGNGRDGLVLVNTLAGFCHLRNTQDSPWIGRFLTFVARCKAGLTTAAQGG